MENQQVSKQVYQLQAGLIGARYAGATISNTKLDNGDAVRVSKWLKEGKGFLVLMGKPGCGKTHLCSALIAWFYGKVPDIYYFKQSKFHEKIRDSFEMKGDYKREVSYQSDHHFLMLDDIGFESEGSGTFRRDVTAALVDLRYESMKPTVFSTNFNEREIVERFGSAVHSRMFAKENTVIDMFGYPDLRMLG